MEYTLKKDVLIDEVFRIYKESEDFLALGPQPTATREMVSKDLEESMEEHNTFYGIYVNQRIVGIVDYRIQGSTGSSDCGYIALIMVSKKQRNAGIGGRVIRGIEEEMKRNGITTCRAHVQVNNEPGIRFWKKNGYQIISDEIMNKDGTTVYEIEKVLSE